MLKIGIIGTGAIGKDHARRIHNRLAGAEVVAVMDKFPDGAKALADELNVMHYLTDDELIADKNVDAVVITSIGWAHYESLIKVVKAGKPVFCEKPMTTNAEDSKKILDAEVAGGKRLVTVGFMRRYDKGYRQMKAVLDSGKIGTPLLAHCTHRNPSVAPDYVTEMAVHDTAIHEIDCMHWLVGDDWESVQVIIGKHVVGSDPSHLADPQTMIFKSKSGIVVNLEVFVQCKFGYDIQCEVVCDEGSVQLPDPTFPRIKHDENSSVQIENDWKNRFVDSYDVELQDWINSTLKGEVNGPTAWDGYMANVTADALVKSQSTGEVEKVAFGETPALYK